MKVKITYGDFDYPSKIDVIETKTGEYKIEGYYLTVGNVKIKVSWIKIENAEPRISDFL